MDHIDSPILPVSSDITPEDALREPHPATMTRPVAPAQIHDDRTVTFRVQAPDTAMAELHLRNQNPDTFPMHRGADGVWEVTVGPLDAEIYEYGFLIAGAMFNTGSLAIPGSPPRHYELLDVPHGELVLHIYYSKVQQRHRRLHVYVPPSYRQGEDERFPVLYLFPANTEDEWVRLGRAQNTLDNGIAEGKIRPAIVVMPNNEVGPRPVAALENAAVMERELIEEIMPFIENRYRTLPGREHRAIAGLSFGAGTAFIVGMRHLAHFAYLGEFSTGLFGGAQTKPWNVGYAAYDPGKVAPDLYDSVSRDGTRLRLLYMSVGSQDPRAPYQRQVLSTFEAHGFEPVFKTFKGAHDWKVFSNSLADFAQRLFR
ncbi:MAG: hypothetical protein ABS76_01875 [Pelagibacterium sp. SCN 64-44]|nr:MAG: hypothetical protein ABS76_01875 [Pelagibacterium sp. SCN 64-44]